MGFANEVELDFIWIVAPVSAHEDNVEWWTRIERVLQYVLVSSLIFVRVSSQLTVVCKVMPDDNDAVVPFSLIQ